MADKQTKRVILKDPVSGATLYPDIGVSIPTKTSDITNDSGFITSSDIPEIPEDLSDLNNDVGFITEVSWSEVTSKPSTFTPATHSHIVSEISDFPTIPSKTSDLNNDSGFLTSLPTASSEIAGVIKVGTGLTITNGVLSADASVITIDSAISGTSTNPVQNKVIKSALDGKQSSITSSNKLDADLIDDSESTNKLATSAQLTAIGTNTSAITTINNTLGGYGDIVTHNASEFAGSSHTHSQYLTSVAWTDISGRPDVNTGKITIQKNGTKVDDFTVNDANNKTINITVPTSAADVSALPDSTDYGASIDLSIDEDYIVTATLKDQNGDTLSTDTIDLPLESVVVSGSYNSTNKKVVLTLQNGSTVDFSVADLVSGLQSEITSSNKLSADLISDGTTNKTVTATEKSTWNGKQNAISDLTTIRDNASAGAGAATTIAGYGDIVTHNASEFLTSHQSLSDYQKKETAVTHTKNTAAGSLTNPVYIASDGTATACTYSLSKSVPSDAVFTDTTYSEFTGATSSANGVAGLVKQPLKADKDKFLKGDGSWSAVSATDTKNTAGATDTSSKIFLVGATSQADDLQTYSHDTAFVDANGRLNSAAPASSANDTTVATTAWVAGKGYLTSVPDIASNKITALTGYTIASSAGSISASDSLNTALGKLQKTINSKQDIGNYASASHTHTKSEITDFPTIPTVNNTTITIKKNGTKVDDFTTNTGTAKSIDISVPTKTSDLTNDSGFLTSVPSHNQSTSSITTLDSYNKSVSGGTGALSSSDSLNVALAKLENALDGKQASGSYASSSHTHTKSQITDFPTIPTKVSDLTNDSGYITGVTSSDINNALGYTPANYFAGGNISIDTVEKVTLPSGYTQVSYIEGTGTQYIDTGWKFSNTYPVKIDCKFIVNNFSGGSGGYPVVYGLQTSAYTNWIYPFYINAGNFNAHIGGSAGIDSVPCTLGQVYDTSFTINNGTWSRTINGSSSSGSWSGTITTAANMFLGGGSYGSNPINQLIGKIFSFKITVNGSVVRNYIPCKRNSDGVAGMYDLATSTFKSSGSGSFLMGSTVTASGDMISAAVPTKVSQLTNDSGYTTNTGTVTSVNNVAPVNGNVTLSIPDAQIQSDWNQTTTTAKDYIKNKPTIPTVNNATLTIQKNGTTVKTFTANASSNVTCNITVPTKTSDLTNDSGFTSNAGTITGITMNGASKGTSGVVDLGTVLTSHQSLSGCVPTSRTINSKALSSNVTLAGGDIAITGYTKASSASALTATDTINVALGKLEKALDGKQASGSYASSSHTHTKSQITDFPTIPTVTDTYSSTSSDAMSGKAVASALSGLTQYAMVVTDYTA